jgi:hypothetical protein
VRVSTSRTPPFAFRSPITQTSTSAMKVPKAEGPKFPAALAPPGRNRDSITQTSTCMTAPHVHSPPTSGRPTVHRLLYDCSLPPTRPSLGDHHTPATLCDTPATIQQHMCYVKLCKAMSSELCQNFPTWPQSQREIPKHPMRRPGKQRKMLCKATPPPAIIAPLEHAFAHLPEVASHRSSIPPECSGQEKGCIRGFRHTLLENRWTP